MTTGDPDIDAQIATEMASILSLESTLNQTRAQLAAAERTIEPLRATRQGLLDDLVKAAGREIALRETIEQLGKDAAAIAGRLDRAIEWVATVFSEEEAEECRVFADTEEAPSQPEPVKHLDHDFEGADPNVCEYPYSMGVCGRPQNAHVPIVPENAGATYSACQGMKGFDPFGVPMEGQTNPAYQCGACQGRGTT